MRAITQGKSGVAHTRDHGACSVYIPLDLRAELGDRPESLLWAEAIHELHAQRPAVEIAGEIDQVDFDRHLGSTEGGLDADVRRAGQPDRRGRRIDVEGP